MAVPQVRTKWLPGIGILQRPVFSQLLRQESRKVSGQLQCTRSPVGRNFAFRQVFHCLLRFSRGARRFRIAPQIYVGALRLATLPIILLLLASCNGNYTPKPAGYPRVVYPEKEYVRFDTTAPYSFEYPAYARMIPDRQGVHEPYWYNLEFPAFNSVVHLSYKPVDGNVIEYVEDSRVLVYKHSSRSDGIEETPVIDTAAQRFGIIYDLKGNVASSVQFFVTDSSTHFLRGSLYFNTSPNRDSLNPVIRFIREDIIHLVETLEWK